MKIWAEDPIIFIDKRRGQTEGNTKIFYVREKSDADIPLGLWYWRFNQPGVVKPALRGWDNNIGIASTPDALQHIILPEPIQPGELFVFRLAYMVNGNITTDDKEITITGLLTDGESDFGIEPLEPQMTISREGGTYFDIKFKTKKIVQGIYCEFDHTIWSVDPSTKRLIFNKQTSAFKHLGLNQIPSQLHDIHIEPVFPGNVYYFIALLIDNNGRWQFFRTAIVTKKRMIQFKIKKLHIIKARPLLEDNLELVHFIHRISIINSENNVDEYISIFHVDKHLGQGNDLIINRPWIFLITPYTIPQFLGSITFGYRSYHEEDIVIVNTGSHGEYESEDIFLKHQDQQIYFPTGYREYDVSTKKIRSITDNHDFEYELTLEYNCHYA